RLFGLWTAQDLNEPSRNTAYLLQGGLAMPDREYYLADNPKMAETRTRYRAHVVKVLGLAGIADADRKAQRIVDLETRIASVHARREDSADVHTAQAWTREDFDRKAPGLDWAGYFGAAGLERQRAFVVWHPAATTGEAALVGSQPIATWKVQSLIVGVGYPDAWRGYAGLEISGDDALGNAMRAEEFEYQYRLRELRQPIDRNEWWITPQTVNALNLPIQNALNFPAAI